MKTNINSILNSISIIDSFNIVYEDEDSAFVKVKSGDANFVIPIDTTLDDEAIKEYVINEVCESVSRHIRIHG